MEEIPEVTIASGATWQEVAADRQKHRDATIAAIEPPLPELKDVPMNTIPLVKQILTPEEIKITETTVEDLIAQVADGKLSSVAVTQAFLRRAALAQKTSNCITELLPTRALERAQYLDTYLKKTGKPIGPLHGIPISVKEHIGMKGLDNNAGFVAWVGTIPDEDVYILQILWNAGAVFYARTTQPQSLMHLETSSNLYGVTTNPFNTSLTAGGSSGGEGALIGFRGSCLGIGTDIGGSIRSPAANNGIYGIKPTSARLPNAGLRATMLGEEHILPVIGPLSTSLLGCKIFMKTLLAAKPWYKQPSLVPMPWKEEDFFPRGKGKGRKVKVAVMWDDGVMRPHPPVTRALRRVVEGLRGNGEDFEVVDWVPWKGEEAWEIIANLYFADGATETLAALSSSNEPLLPLTTHITTANPHLQHHDIASLWAATIKRDEFRAAYAELWNKTATGVNENGEMEGMVDVILCPVGPGVAPKVGTAKWWGYTSLWNLLDYPAVVFPVDRVDGDTDYRGVGVTGENMENRGKEGEEKKYTPRNERDAENWKLWEKHGEEGYKNAPVSLQLVGRRYEDEKVVQALEIMMKEVGLPFVEYV